jgi:hypothetical protein
LGRDFIGIEKVKKTFELLKGRFGRVLVEMEGIWQKKIWTEHYSIWRVRNRSIYD